MAQLLGGKADQCVAQEIGPYAAVRAMCLFTLGREREATRIVDSLSAAFTAGTAGDSTFSPALVGQGLAQYYAWVGNPDQSLAWMERTYAITPDGEDHPVFDTGLYDKVKDNPRFKAGMDRIRARIYDRVLAARPKL